MVQSLLVDNLNYSESLNIEPEDINYNTSLFEGKILGFTVIVAIGQGKHDLSDKGIVYYPIYAIKGDTVYKQIGVYELLSSKISESIDDSGVFNPTLGNACLYSFVTEDFVKKIAVSKKSKHLLDDSKELSNTENLSSNLLSEQTKKMAKQERENYVEKKDDPWVKKFFKNSNYDLVKILGNGDCFFTTIQKGLQSVEQDVSVRDMREILSNKATNEIFENYQTQYRDANAEHKKIRSEIKEMKNNYQKLKEKMQVIEDRSEKVAITMQMNEIKQRHKRAKKEFESAAELSKEFAFMENVNTFDEFKQILLTREYWADTWAISTLENILKIKVIILSKEVFESNDVENVLQCGQLNDDVVSEPSHYIITSYDGRHYELVTYKGRASLGFKELPYDVKKMVVDKCLEGLTGSYHNIKEFKDFLIELDVSPDVRPDVEVSPELYDNGTTFQFSSRSADAKAGKGSGETIGPEGLQSYTELNGIDHWRRKLSNEWKQEFILDGKRWESVEIYMYAVKYKKNNPSFYEKFSLDSGSKISKDLKLAKEASEKKKTDLRPVEVKVDTDFDNKRRDEEMTNALRAKFTQNKELTRMLKATKRAKIQKYVNKSLPLVMTQLMRLRSNLVSKP